MNFANNPTFIFDIVDIYLYVLKKIENNNNLISIYKCLYIYSLYD
jgi:hypothetical protein